MIKNCCLLQSTCSRLLMLMILKLFLIRIGYEIRVYDRRNLVGLLQSNLVGIEDLVRD